MGHMVAAFCVQARARLPSAAAGACAQWSAQHMGSGVAAAKAKPQPGAGHGKEALHVCQALPDQL